MIPTVETKKRQNPLAFVLGGLSFIPLCGVPFGTAAIVWGAITWKRGGKLVLLLGVLGISLTIALYGSLYYFGFVQRGGIYDSLRVQLAESNLSTLVQSIEFYKLQNEHYPSSLEELSKASIENGNPVFTTDPSTMVGGNTPPREYYYEVTKDGSGYYLLGVGPDGLPFTSDDILPTTETKNTGLLIDPDSN